MSNEQNNQDFLVEQDEALGFYFDSLLATHETEFLDDMQASTEVSERALVQEQNSKPAIPNKETKNKQTLNKQSDNISDDQDGHNTESARAFLQASRLRQQRIKSQNTELKDAGRTTSEVPAQTITPGPVAPKLRKAEDADSKDQVKLQAKVKTPEPVIVFTEKDKNGNIKEEVIIPRSQRLAQKSLANKVMAKTGSVTQSQIQSQTQSVSSVQAKKNSPLKPRSKSVQALNSQQETETTLTQQITVKQSRASITKEAPELDLSLFLPQIKTLSDKEIRQQLEALTQAAVSQVQVEAELQELSQYEKYKQQTQQGDSEALINNINNAPDWSIPEFQALLFAVSGLKLALPLSELNGIVEWGDEYINELPGHASWYLGLINHLGQNIPVIDTLQQVVPKERWPAEHLEHPCFKHIIVIDKGRWGLACEQVLEIITLKTEQVKWRTSRTRRRWLLGTVIEEKCALLDSSEFASMLETGKDSLITGST